MIKITDKSINWQTINKVLNIKVKGICDLGLIDLISEMHNLKLINKSGKLIDREDCQPEINKEIKKRIIKEKEGNKFLLIKSKETESGNPIFLTQKDIREI